jgi:succinate dehydrogenase / fumarate reductase cytochrome b subunit
MGSIRAGYVPQCSNVNAASTKDFTDGPRRHWQKARPLSPHLSIWRWGPAMFTSIMHRVSGNGLAVVGLGALLCWLGTLAAGPEAYAKYAAFAVSPLGRIIFVGISWAYFNHLCSGLRHLLMDIGGGFEVKTNNMWSILTHVFGVALTVAFWAILLLR